MQREQNLLQVRTEGKESRHYRGTISSVASASVSIASVSSVPDTDVDDATGNRRREYTVIADAGQVRPIQPTTMIKWPDALLSLPRVKCCALKEFT